MLHIPTRAEYAALVEKANLPEENNDFMYECVCNFARNVEAAHEIHPELSYDELAKDYIEWLKKNQ